MAAPKGNQFWKLRSKHGRDKLFEDAELLKQAAYEYFEWCQENPFKEQDFIKGGNSAGELVTMDKMRPFTLAGFTIYCGASVNWLSEFKKTASVDFLEVITHIEEVIKDQKFSGAAAGFFNANIISRDLGLVDKKQHEINDIQPLFPDA